VGTLGPVTHEIRGADVSRDSLRPIREEERRPHSLQGQRLAVEAAESGILHEEQLDLRRRLIRSRRLSLDAAVKHEDDRHETEDHPTRGKWTNHSSASSHGYRRAPVLAGQPTHHDPPP